MPYALRLTSTRLKEQDVEVYKYIKLCKPIKGIREGRFTTQTRPQIARQFSVQLLLLTLTAFSVWGAVEGGILTQEPKESDAFSYGVMLTFGASMISLCCLSCLVNSRKAFTSEKIRPSETTGNLRRWVNQYNEIVPNTPLEDRLMSSQEYLAAFEEARD